MSVPLYQFDALVAMYRRYPVAVAAMCDEFDRSGALLGQVRDAARGALDTGGSAAAEERPSS